MKYVMMIATAIVLVASGANALTLKSGEVLTKDENGNSYVAPAHETASAKAKLANDGVFVGGGVVAVQFGDHVVTVPVEELRGKDRDEIAELIGEAAVAQLEDMYADGEALVAELAEQGIDAYNAIGSTLQDEVDAILSDSYDQIVGGSQAAADYLVANDPDTVHPDGSPEQKAAEAAARAANGH